MKTCIIFNPNAGTSAKGAAVREAAELHPDVTVLESKDKGDAARFATEAALDGFELVVAAGGDGTSNDVINGLVVAKRKACFGIIPLGTGNDLPRTLAIPIEPMEAFELLSSGRERAIDLMSVEHGQDTLVGVNVGAGGFTGQMNEAMTDDLKDRWGPLAYLRGAIKVLPDLTRYRTRIRYDDASWEVVNALNIVVANGRTAGGGIVVAPLANPEDGLLDVVIVRAGGTLDMAGVVARLLAGDYLNSDVVTHRRAGRVWIESEPGMTFNIDGELLSDNAIGFAVQPRALRVIVGPGYEAAPPSA